MFKLLKLKYVLGGFAVVASLDVITTFTGLTLGFGEANPLFNGNIGLFVILLATLKIVTMAPLTVFYVKTNGKMFKAVSMAVILFLVCLNAHAVLNNFLVLFLA
jgi:hypothetical protein